MSKVLFGNIHTLVRLQPQQEDLHNVDLLVDGNKISKIGALRPEDINPDIFVDCEDKIMFPGFINTHHHFYQSLFRNIPAVNNSALFEWLTYLYEKWKQIDEEAIYVSTITTLLELLFSGVTTTTDQHYIFPKGCEKAIDRQIEAARTVGIRFHPCRGSMSLSKEKGGLPPKSVVQQDDEILADSIRLIRKYHSSDPFSMLQIALAPCSPFSVTPELMKQTAELADHYGVLLHTHLAETKDEEDYCLEKFGMRPVEYVENVGWLRDDAWFAHLVHVNQQDIRKLGAAHVGMSYCPTSNMITGAGIAPVKALERAGVRVSIGVDGSSANDMSNITKEVRQGMLLQRVKYGPQNVTARDVLRYATYGGAKVLHREAALGSLDVGKAADIIMFDLDILEFAGGLLDPTTAIVFCDAPKVNFSMVNGKVLIQDGKLVDDRLPLCDLVKRHNEISAKLLGK